MALRLIRNRDLLRRPWKNGGGTTAEVAVYPAAAGLEDFDWRISMADVSTEGPFSLFTGIDRSLALVGGGAVDLDVEGVTHRLDSAAPVLSFRGEVATSARLPAGAIRDLNVMTRRSRFSHRMAVLGPDAPPRVMHADIAAVVALEDLTEVVADGEVFSLDLHDILIAEPGSVTLVARRAVILVAIARLPSSLAPTSSPA